MTAGQLSPAGGAAAASMGVSLSAGATAIFSDISAGDLAGEGEEVDARRAAIVARPWTVLRQVHGARVVAVDHPGHRGGEAADAAVTTVAGAALAVLTADCAPVAFSSPEGVLGVAHAGWRGLQAGVLEATVQAMRERGASEIEAVLGPCIHPCCYQFAPSDLAALSDRFGAGIEAQDRAGRPALDVPAAVEIALAGAGVDLASRVPVCTGCSSRHWSWRARGDRARQATVVWR